MQYLVTRQNFGIKVDGEGKTVVAHQGQILEEEVFASDEDLQRFLKKNLIAPWDPKKDNGEGKTPGGIMDEATYKKLRKQPAPPAQPTPPQSPAPNTPPADVPPTPPAE